MSKLNGTKFNGARIHRRFHPFIISQNVEYSKIIWVDTKDVNQKTAQPPEQ